MLRVILGQRHFEELEKMYEKNEKDIGTKKINFTYVEFQNNPTLAGKLEEKLSKRKDRLCDETVYFTFVKNRNNFYP